MPLPTFLVIGASRSGTTSVHHYLGQHPQVFTTAIKEPGYFLYMDGPVRPGGVAAEWLRRTAVPRRADYEALFAAAGDARARGESTPLYLSVPEVPGRIHRLVPEARLVALLRQPAERAHSQWLGVRRDYAGVPARFEDWLAGDGEPRVDGWLSAAIVESNRYATHLRRYLELFPRQRLRVHLYDDLVADPHRVLRDLFEFLEVEPAFVPDFTQRHGRTGIVRNPLLRRFWLYSGSARRLARPFLPRRLRDLAFDRVVRDLERPPLDAEIRARITAPLRDEIRALEDLLGRDLSHWLA